MKLMPLLESGQHFNRWKRNNLTLSDTVLQNQTTPLRLPVVLQTQIWKRMTGEPLVGVQPLFALSLLPSVPPANASEIPDT